MCSGEFFQIFQSSYLPLLATTSENKNCYSSNQGVFFEITDLKFLRKVPGNHPSISVLLGNIKKNNITDFFLGTFSNFPEQLF